MDEKERNQFVDELLDASLAGYSTVTPRPGLEGRILAHVRAAQARRSWFVWAGWLGAGATAALIVIGVFSLAHRVTIPAPPKTVEVLKPGVGLGLRKGPVAGPPSQQIKAPRKPEIQRARSVNALVTRAEVRQPVFPSPAPLTSEEKLLMQYVHATPAAVLSAPSTETAQIAEIQIKDLEIPPLADETADSKNKQ
jgi:hypothetical protein